MPQSNLRNPISIHVPSRGTTIFSSVYFMFRLDFNPRTLKGYDAMAATTAATMPNFNPRTLKGYDSLAFWIIRFFSRFQSTYPQGVRLYDIPNRYKSGDISIHVPSRGTTFPLKDIMPDIQISIHVPSRGTTRDVGTNRTEGKISIHVPSRGTTRSR